MLVVRSAMIDPPHAFLVRCGLALVLVAGLVGCRGGDAPPARPASSVARPLPAEPDDPMPASPAAAPENLSLYGRLAREAESRPAGAVRTEALVAALKDHGIPVARSRQVLGKTLNARYCGIAVTGAGLVASVCEFDSALDARAALKDSEQRFGKAMPDRRLMTNGKSLLTIANLRAAGEQEARSIAAIFTALRAT
jgi:hypothetical protein